MSRSRAHIPAQNLASWLADAPPAPAIPLPLAAGRVEVWMGAPQETVNSMLPHSGLAQQPCLGIASSRRPGLRVGLNFNAKFRRLIGIAGGPLIINDFDSVHGFRWCPVQGPNASMNRGLLARDVSHAAVRPMIVNVR
jgi:hypothetical protein